MSVVDEQQQGPFLGRCCEDGQGSRTDGEPRCLVLDDAEGGPKRRRLGRREEIEPVEERPAELIQRRERHLRLGFDAVRPDDVEVGRRRSGRILEQGGLADPGLADEDERHARPAACLLQQLLYPVLLRSPSKQHSAIVSDRVSGHKTRDFPGARTTPLADDVRT
jgi:hypothetical protein